MHDETARLMRSEDDLCAYLDTYDDQNIDQSNQPDLPLPSAAMPDEYYQGLEIFLSAPPPSIGEFSKTDKRVATKVTAKSMLKRAQTNAAMVHQRKPQFDYNLLREAIQYADTITTEDNNDHNSELILHKRPEKPSRAAPQHVQIQQQQHRHQHRHQKGSSMVIATTTTSKKKKMPRRLRATVGCYAQKAREASWSAPCAGDTREVITTSSTMEIASLVENFEKAITFESLRKELAISQASLNKSQDVIAKAADEWFKTKTVTVDSA